MSDFDPRFLLPSEDKTASIQAIKRKIRAWITSSWLADLVELFGGTINAAGNLDDLLQNLETFSDVWDFRRMARQAGATPDDALRKGMGAARWHTTGDGIPAAIQDHILLNAAQLGLIHALDPVSQYYDCILALGGARLSCKLRPLRAAEVMQSGVKASMVGLLAAPRPIADTERDATDTYAPGAMSEFDAMLAGGQHAFGFDLHGFDEQRFEHPTNPHLSWIVRKYNAVLEATSVPVVVISAPSSDPERRRANSADTLAFFLDRQKIQRKARLLLVTSQIYVPYVQLEALRTVGIPRGIHVETIGFPGDRMPELQGLTSPHHYLQEMRSTIQAARRFCQAYPQ